MNPFAFYQELNAILQLEAEGKKGEIFAGHLEEMDLHFHPYGFHASVAFRTFDDDEMKELFAKEKMMQATLTFKSTDPKKEGTPLLELKGIVNNRSYRPIGDPAKKQATRLYQVDFSDAATVSWGHHFPFNIFVDQTMKDVIDGEKNPLLSIQYDWDVLNEVHPIIALPVNKHISFYSFITWYLKQKNGIFEYNYKENNYSFLGKKKEDGEPVKVTEAMITPATCQFPEPSRSLQRTVKHSAENRDNTDQDNPNGFDGVRNDTFDEADYRHFPDQIPQAVHSKGVREKPSIQFSLQELTPAFNISELLPGTLIQIKGKEASGGDWCGDPPFKDQVFRISNVSFKATQTAPPEVLKKPVQTYHLNIDVTAESKDETFIPRPPFQEPVYPFSIPGKIFSEIGDPEQTTFNVVKHEKAPLGQYLVKVPLAGEDKKVVVPFTPDFTSGQSYFPLCKDQQVMLSMYFQTAKIERILDWQPLTRLPLDTQANQIVFGSNGKDKYFIQKHEFKNGKDPVFLMKQSSSPEQSQSLQMQEKDMIFIVDEKGKNLATIQLNRESGLLVKVKDEASGTTHQSLYNPDSITHSSEGKSGKSLIVQTPDSVSIECKKFNVKCEEGVIDASKTFTQNAKNKIFLSAPVVNAKDQVLMGG